MNQLLQNSICIIYGPTGVGKTELANHISRILPVEIINMDVGQFYSDLSIGTAKPDLGAVTVAHHLFNELRSPIDFSVTAYRDRVKLLLADIWSRGALPVLVGGSGFYMRSLFFPPCITTEGVPSSDHEGYNSLWDKLQSIDPVRASQIPYNDTYRLSRALHIWSSTGQRPSECKPGFEPISDALIVHVTRERSELYDRINQRVSDMLKRGWVDEVKGLLGNQGWVEFIHRKKLIGYDDILSYLSSAESQVDREHVEKTIAQRTRNYAKRQETYWRMFERELAVAVAQTKLTRNVTTESINLTLTSGDIGLYIKRLLYSYRKL